jgi:uncharacterized protein (TIGR02996 family)
MPNTEAFLEAIVADPDADGPRLVYADWLDEQGDPVRAEFIRTQIALARMAEEDPRRPELTARMHHLERAVREGWLREKPALIPDALVTWFRGGSAAFVRGMVESVYMKAGAFLANATSLFRTWPIRRVHLSELQPAEVPRLAACRWLERVTALETTSTAIDGDCVAELTASPHLANLRELSLNAPIGPEGAVALARAELRLEHLSLSRGHIGPLGAVALANWPSLSGVTRLELGSNDLDSAGVEPLFYEAGNLGRLTRLGLSRNDITAAGARAVARFERVGTLESLELMNNPLGDAGVAHLADSPYLRRLLYLGLASTGCGPEGARALARSPVLESVRKLKLGSNHIGPEGATALARSPGMAALEHLNLEHNAIGDEGAHELLTSAHPARLTELNLSSNGLRCPGVWTSEASAGLPSLGRLDLDFNRLDDDAARALARWPVVGRLQFLQVSANQIGDEGALALARSPHVAKLRHLSLRNNRLTQAAANAIKAAGRAAANIGIGQIRPAPR